MVLNLKRKNVILKDYNLGISEGLEGIEIMHRREQNGEDYMSILGSKGQINAYLQDKNVLSDRMRTLKNVPKYRMINTHLIEIY